jgi:LytS/YehU family sensor histidine kinase
MRYAYEPNLILEVDVKDPEQQIAPFLLIPFIENAFKHGDLSLPEQPVHIHLESDKNNLHLTVENPVRQQEKDKASGIGLENVRRRLALLYPDSHDLDIHSDGQTFIVNLKIQFPS